MSSNRRTKSWKLRTEAAREAYKHLCDRDCRRRCWYCGEIAETIDHSPAIDVVLAFGQLNLISSGIELLLIPSCKECNCLLGSVMLFYPESRGFWLHEKLAKRYEKILNGGTFDEVDLSEFGPNLKKYLRTQTNVKIWVERRLSFTGRFPICEVALRELRKNDMRPKKEQKQTTHTEVLQRLMSHQSMGENSS